MAKIVQVNPSLFDRRHPAFEPMRAHWEFVEQTYRGGRGWFETNIFKYFREGDNEFDDRKKRSYRFNHTREVVDLVTKYVFKQSPERNETDAPEELKRFWKKATKNGEDIGALMRQVSRGTSLFGQPYIVVDSTMRDAVVTKDDEKKLGARVYAYMVKPQHALDMSFDEHGELNWILLYESKREDDDFFSSHAEYGCYRLWTRTHTYLYKVRQAKSDELSQRYLRPIGSVLPVFRSSAQVYGGAKPNLIVEELQSVEHELGVVPVIPVRDRDSDNEYTAPGLVDDIAYLDRANANYLSNLDAIIQDQTFSTLTIPVQSLDAAEDGYSKIIEMGTKRIFAYDAEGGKGPEYISPDPSQAQIILAVITKIITEIYHSIGMAGERTKMDNAAGIDNSSGVAKAYDFDRMNTMLKAKADRLEEAENKISELVMLWHGKRQEMEQYVVYPTDFDTRNLYDEFDVANKLALLMAPEQLRRHQMEKLVEKLFPALAKDLRNAIASEMKEWPVDSAEMLTAGASDLQDRSVPTPDNQQGQNNSE